MPVEIPSPIRFDEDAVHAAYDPDYANRFWRILTRVEEVFTRGLEVRRILEEIGCK